MFLSLPDINNIIFNISCYNKQWFFMTSDIHPFSLADCKKMGPVMRTNYFSDDDGFIYLTVWSIFLPIYSSETVSHPLILFILSSQSDLFFIFLIIYSLFCLQVSAEERLEDVLSRQNKYPVNLFFGQLQVQFIGNKTYFRFC